MYIIRRILSDSIFHWLSLLLLPGILLLLLFTQLGLARAISPSQNTQITARASITALSIEQSILDNIKQNGFDDNSQINGGLGGLWINWLYGSDPLETNFNNSGKPDGSGVIPPRHDELTDLRYLHSLWLYKSQSPEDTQYNSEITRYTAIVQHEFASTGNTRGWLFDEEFMDLYRLSKDPFYLNAALSLVKHYSRNIDPKVGIIYQSNSAHPHGYYRPDLAIEQGCALIIAGYNAVPKNTQWIQQGQAAINFVYAHAYIAQYHAFPDQLDQVLLSGGGVNPSETFYMDSSKDGSLMKVGSTAQIIIALLHTYQATSSITFLNDALDLLNASSQSTNALGQLWDPTYLGFYQQVNFTGTGPKKPGNMTVDTSNKESGRQESMLWALHLANLLTTSRPYAVLHTRETQMRMVAQTKAYYAPGHGILYEMSRQWTPDTVNHHPETWVTTEAMGIELECLMEETGSADY